MFASSAKASAPLYPLSPEAHLKSRFVGKDLRDVECPAAVLDVAKVRKNCAAQLRAVDLLGVSFRAHVKTHKTVEATAFQVGQEPDRPVRLVASTVAEAEHLLPWLQSCKSQGRETSLLYGIAPSSTCFARFEGFRQAGIPVAYMLDHPAQIANLVDADQLSSEASGDSIQVFVKIDTGYHRAGIGVDSPELRTLLEAIAQHSKPDSSAPRLKLLGLYSHLGSSYGVGNPNEALKYLKEELDRGTDAVKFVSSLGLDFGLAGPEKLVLSIGATPTATAAQNLESRTQEAQEVERVLKSLQTLCDVELHAGVYPMLDMQQIATHARPASGGSQATESTMNESDISFTVLAEVLSVYPERPSPEAIVSAGVLALGREPAKNYSGFGVVAADPWRDTEDVPRWSDASQTGWIVGRVAQEHGILTWQGVTEGMKMPSIGEKLSIIPNHACIAGAQFGWYYVVDSDTGSKTQITDIWIRARGW